MADFEQDRPGNNTSDADGQQMSDFDMDYSEGADPVKLAQGKNFEREAHRDANAPGSTLDTSPGIPSPVPSHETADLLKGVRPGRNDQPQLKGEVQAKSYLSPVTALFEGFLGSKNSQLEEKPAKQEKTPEEIEAERLAQQKKDLETEEDATNPDVSEEMKQAAEEDDLEEDDLEDL